MDSRCPRSLDSFPDSWCPLAVQRLKAVRNFSGKLTEEEESKLPGCPWAVNHQMANYCFFKLVRDHMPEHKDLSDMEIAHFCGVDLDDIKKSEKRALSKIRNNESFEEIRNDK